MKKITLLFMLAFPIFLISATHIINSNGFNINNISFSLEPSAVIRTPDIYSQELDFVKTNALYPDSCTIIYGNSNFDLEVKIVPVTKFIKKAWQVSIIADYKQAVSISDISLNINFTNPGEIAIYKGPQAIYSRLMPDQKNLCPYTDKAIEYKGPTSSFWIVASNYAGCQGIESITDSSIKLYDNSLHYARLYNQVALYDKLIDYLPRVSGQRDNWSFLIFLEKPNLISINRWPADKLAALAITNDADGENLSKLQSVFYGSSNIKSPDYLTKGLIANQIKISNTVFGVNINYLYDIWTDIKNTGSSIGYHTYSGYDDTTSVINQSLNTDMDEFDVRLWIDHAHNLEDISMSGSYPNSPYYVLDVLNNSKIDYLWIYDIPYNNAFNAFEEPWRLPHKLHYFSSLTKPIWIFGRTRMETWEYLSDYYLYDFKHNMTGENLDNLLKDNGLCIGYTHFSFNNASNRYAFYNLLPGDEYTIRDDFNDVLVMLNDYQQNRGLWIDTVENIFDRMLAIEQVDIESVEDDVYPGFVRISLRNNSNYDITDLSFTYGPQEITIPQLNAHGNYSFSVSSTNIPSPDDALLPFQVFYIDKTLLIRSKQSHVIPAAQVSIYNIKGQLVSSNRTTKQANYMSIPFEHKASGIYIARIETLGYKPQNIRFTVLK